VLDVQLSATARLADYVIPSQLSLERPDVPTTVDRWFEQPYTIYTPAVLEPDPELVGEAGLYVELAHRMGVPVVLPGGPVEISHTPDDLLDLCYPNTRIPLAELRGVAGGTIRPELSCTVAPADPDCTARFDVTPDGIVDELDEVRNEDAPFGRLAGYDPHVHRYRMATRRLKSVFNSTGREIEDLRSKEGTNFAHMHPDDLRDLGVADGELVEVASPRGAVRTVAKAAPDVKRGTVSMAHAWGDLPGEAGPPADPHRLGDCTGRLIDNATNFDPHTGLPTQSAIPVAVRGIAIQEPIA